MNSLSDSAARFTPVLSSRSPVVAIVGATGAVGAELLHCLDRRGFPIRQLKLLASGRSAGKRLEFQGRSLAVEETTEAAFEGVDLALFSAGGETSRRFAPLAVRAGAIVVDNSSAFRMDETVPLVVPEINAGAIAQHRGIIANPNCTAIVAITPLWPVHRANPIRRIILSSYQAASGAGAAAMAELAEGTRAHLEGRDFTPKTMPHPYAFNVFSHNSRMDVDTGYNDEETKVMKEARKIFGDDSLRVSATCVRVPVFRAHAVSVTFECEHPIAPESVRGLIGAAPGVKLVDDRERNYFPMPRDASGQDDILVGRIRQDVSDPSGRST